MVQGEGTQGEEGVVSIGTAKTHRDSDAWQTYAAREDRSNRMEVTFPIRLTNEILRALIRVAVDHGFSMKNDTRRVA